MIGTVCVKKIPMFCRGKISLNTLANESTFKVLDDALQQGVNLQEVMPGCGL